MMRILMFVLCMAATLGAQGKASQSSRLADVLEAVSLASQANFTLRPPSLGDERFSFAGDMAVADEDVLSWLGAVLSAQDLELVALAGFDRHFAVERRGAHRSPADRFETITADELEARRHEESGRFTILHRLTWLTPEAALRFLRRFLRQRPGLALASPEVQGLLLVECPAVLWRVRTILNAVDRRPSLMGRRVATLRLLNHDASRLAESLGLLSGFANADARASGRQDSAASFLVAADRSTNALVISGPEDLVHDLLEVAALLDLEAVAPENDLVVYHLSNLDSLEAEMALRDAFGLGEVDRPEDVTSTQERRGRGRVSSGRNEATAERTSRRRLTPRDDLLPEGLPAPRIVAVPDQHALVVRAIPSVQEWIAKTLKDLDRRRLMVEAEIIAVEIYESEAKELAVELADLDGIGAIKTFITTGFGFAEFQGDRLATAQRQPPLGLRGLAAGIFDEAVGLPFFIRALEEEVSRDRITKITASVEENGTARISSGQQVPVGERITSARRDTGFPQPIIGADDLRQVERFTEFIGAETALSVSPKRLVNGEISLAVEIEIAAFTTETTTSLIPPPRSSQRIVSEVTVQPGGVVPLGQVSSRSRTESRSGVPGLSDLPLLGSLFESRSNRQEERRLFFFLSVRVRDYQ